MGDKVRESVDAIQTFLAMGGYAAFVWPAFGLTALVLVVLWLQSWRELRQREAELDVLPRLPSRKDRRASVATGGGAKPDERGAMS